MSVWDDAHMYSHQCVDGSSCNVDGSLCNVDGPSCNVDGNDSNHCAMWIAQTGIRINNV